MSEINPNSSSAPTLGRPTQYSVELAAEILSAIATTNKGLAPLCDANPHWPEPRTIYRWMMAHDTFCQNYTRAKEDQTQVLEDEILAIADNTELGEVVTDKGDKVEVRRGDMIEHRKLRIESRKWLMGKLRPKKYGDKVSTELSGSVTVTDTSKLAELSDDDLEKLAGIVAKITK